MRWRDRHIWVDEGVMRVRLVRKLADRLDGVDVSGHSSGDILELSRRDAELLIAERWAEPEAAAAREQPYRRRAEDRIRDAVDRRAPRGEAISASADPAGRVEAEHTDDVNHERIGTQRDDRDR
jgi:hypothetical protein